MTDTSEKTSEVYRNMLMKRSGEERLIMGGEMFEAARAMMEAGFDAEGIYFANLWRRL